MPRQDSLLRNPGSRLRHPRSGLTPVDPSVTGFDERSTPDAPYGFVYFDGQPNYDGSEVRVGYIGGLYDPASERDKTLHDVPRYKPYVFNANWGVPTYGHLVAAWDFLVDAPVPGFPEYAASHPGVLRWMNGADFVAADLTTLEMAAIKERNDALRRTRGTRTRRPRSSVSAESESAG